MPKVSLLLRSVLAIALMVTFYALAVAVAAGLLYGALHLGEFLLGNLRGRAIILLGVIIAGMGFAGLVVLWSIVPRIDRFTPPGPELDEGEQPALFKELRRVAALTGQEPPAHVYLVPDVNAFVTERGGWMGIGSRRVMGLGLALINVLTVSELRAVIAHEFGHFHGGDTKLGPWIYKTRGSIIRTVQNLFQTAESTAEAGGELSVFSWVMVAVGKPFDLFARLYLRITHALSRAQEYSADKIAVQTHGAAALIEGLKKTHRAGVAFGHFLGSELGPVLSQKRRPPIGDGFRRYLDREEIARQLEALENDELQASTQDPYDTHPPLRERIRHALSLGAPLVKDDGRPATELLADIPALELRLLAHLSGDEALEPIRWEQVGELMVPGWRRWREELGRALPDATVGTLSAEPSELRRVAQAVLQQDVSAVSEEDLRAWTTGRYTAAICSALADAGFTTRTAPGAPVTFSRGEAELEPVAITRRYLAGELSPEAWVSTWRELGIDDVPIAVADEAEQRSA